MSEKTEYIPFGPEWVQEVMKGSKVFIVELYRNCAIKKKNIELEKERLQKERDGLRSIIDEFVDILECAPNAHERLTSVMNKAKAALSQTEETV